MTTNIGIRVKGYRPESESNEVIDDIREEMIQYRSEKASNLPENNFPFQYTVSVNAGGEDPETAFYSVAASTTFRIGIEPGTRFETAEKLTDAIQFSADKERHLTAYPENTSEHLPLFEEADELMRENGYSTATGFYDQIEGKTVEETLQKLVEEGVHTFITLRGEKLEFEFSDEEYTRDDFVTADLVYDAESNKFQPTVDNAVIPTTEEGEPHDGKMTVINERIDDIETEVEQLLDDEDLLV